MKNKKIISIWNVIKVHLSPSYCWTTIFNRKKIHEKIKTVFNNWSGDPFEHIALCVFAWVGPGPMSMDDERSKEPDRVYFVCSFVYLTTHDRIALHRIDFASHFLEFKWNTHRKCSQARSIDNHNNQNGVFLRSKTFGQFIYSFLKITANFILHIKWWWEWRPYMPNKCDSQSNGRVIFSWIRLLIRLLYCI